MKSESISVLLVEIFRRVVRRIHATDRVGIQLTEKVSVFGEFRTIFLPADVESLRNK
jgi:hypothetical protein